MENGRMEHRQTKNIDFGKGEGLDILWVRKEIFHLVFLRCGRSGGRVNTHLWAFLWNILAMESPFSIPNHLSPCSRGHHAVHIRYLTYRCPDQSHNDPLFL